METGDFHSLRDKPSSINSISDCLLAVNANGSVFVSRAFSFSCFRMRDTLNWKTVGFLIFMIDFHLVLMVNREWAKSERADAQAGVCGMQIPQIITGRSSNQNSILLSFMTAQTRCSRPIYSSAFVHSSDGRRRQRARERRRRRDRDEKSQREWHARTGSSVQRKLISNIRSVKWHVDITLN